MLNTYRALLLFPHVSENICYVFHTQLHGPRNLQVVEKTQFWFEVGQITTSQIRQTTSLTPQKLFGASVVRLNFPTSTKTKKLLFLSRSR